MIGWRASSGNMTATRGTLWLALVDFSNHRKLLARLWSHEDPTNTLLILDVHPYEQFHNSLSDALPVSVLRTRETHNKNILIAHVQLGFDPFRPLGAPLQADTIMVEG